MQRDGKGFMFFGRGLTELLESSTGLTDDLLPFTRDLYVHLSLNLFHSVYHLIIPKMFFDVLLHFALRVRVRVIGCSLPRPSFGRTSLVFVAYRS